MDQYFNAVKAKDNQTLSSFSSVTFDKPVESWKITATSEEQKTPLTTPGPVGQGARDSRDRSRRTRRTRARTSTRPRSTR